MTEEQATYATTKEINPDEQVTYKVISRGVFVVRGNDFPALICECHTSRWHNITHAQACEMAERIAKMMNGQAI